MYYQLSQTSKHIENTMHNTSCDFVCVEFIGNDKEMDFIKKEDNM